MNRVETLRKAMALVDAVLVDLANLDKALDEWPEPMPIDHNLLENAKWHLNYIYNDSDLRSEEPEYEKRQIMELGKIRDAILKRLESL